MMAHEISPFASWKRYAIIFPLSNQPERTRTRHVSSMRLGLHVSIAGRLSLAAERAEALGCNAMQIFSRSPRGWAAPEMDAAEIARFRGLREKSDIRPLAIHASYLINLASADPALSRRSRDGLIDELSRGEKLGADYLVVHVGSVKGGTVEGGIRRVTKLLRQVLKSAPPAPMLLLENMAGERGDVGARLEDLAGILDGLDGNGRVGVCLDTCHLFAAGYDIRTKAGVDSVSKEIQSTIGAERIKLIHMNDSKKGLGCGVDRHQHIGGGGIGLAGFRAFVNHSLFRGIPVILETPKDSPEADTRNLGIVRKLRTKEKK
jgi:deoxyribonuclease IV